jgi:alpha-L-rhamnosidase
VQGGERYERVTLTTPGTVTLRSAGIDFTALRETPGEMQGHFYSSDEELNRIWYASVYTLNLNQLPPGAPTDPGGTNQLHLILDGAKRDRAVWSGDHLISDLTDYYASDPVYARDSDALFLEHPATTAGDLEPAVGDISQPGPLPGACSPDPAIMNTCITWSATYSMVVMSSVYNYYLYTGDLAFVRDHWPAVIRQMAWDAQQVGSDGLFAVSGADDDDWNLESIPGELTYVNAVYVQALDSAAKLAAAIGDGGDAQKWAAAAAAVKSAVNRLLWDPKTGVYDGSTSNRGSVVQDANVTAILAGLAAPARARAITRILAAKLATRFGPAATGTPVPAGYTHDISPFMGSFNLLADFAAGNEPAALATMRQEWGYMLSQDPGGVDWERIQPDGIPAAGAVADSMAHAWSTGPAPALSKYVLGVAPATPGFDGWSIAPRPGDLRWAQGIVPTPHGQITVAWKQTGTRAFVLSIDAPRGTSGTVTLPRLGRKGLIAEDGHLLRRGRLVLRGISGRHTFAWVTR